MSQRQSYWVTILLSLSIALGASGDRPALAETGGQVDKVTRAAPLVEKTRSGRRLKVLVGLRRSHRPEGELGKAASMEQRQKIALEQKSLLEALAGYQVTSTTSFGYVPYMAMEVDAAALQMLLDSDAVATVEEDLAVPPSLASTIPIVGADEAGALGFTGTGQAVAILDTGIQALHPFFGGRIVSEACYSNGSPTSKSTSLCPNGLQTQTGTGSAEVTIPACFDETGGNLCAHGSHIAGIAAGNGSGSRGVASSADIIAIQIYTRFSDCGTGPCVASYTSDQIRGLERVYQLRDDFDIAAVNLSLGSETFTSQSSCDSSNTAMKSAIDLLRSVGIATVISAGNGGSTDGLTAPGCISSAISVGATDDADTVASFSNSASFLDLLAPGTDVRSSVPEDGLAVFHGTSMSAAHVTGAWAVYKQLIPDASVTTVEVALKATGTPVTDSRNGLTIPRLDIGQAITSATTPSARILVLSFPPRDINLGGQVRLRSQVWNTGAVALPADAEVEYWVNGPAWTGAHRVGTASVAGLAPGARQWVYLDWSIDCTRSPGDYRFWARVISGADTVISPWYGPESFTVGSDPIVEILRLREVSGATVGGNARLSVRVRNSGCSALPASSRVRFAVQGPLWTGSPLVGTRSLAGLAPGAARWSSFDWNIASTRPAGDYSYWAQMLLGSHPTSEWEGPENFLVTGLAFDSTFSGSAGAWEAHNGTWSVVGDFLYTEGVPGERASVSYPQTVADFEFEVRFWRTGSNIFNANSLMVRGTPNPLDPVIKHWNQAYLFQTSSVVGRFAVHRVNGARRGTLKGWTRTEAVRSSGWNTLRVRAVGSSLSFFINGTLVWSGTDTTFTSGKVGFGMYRSPESSGNGFWVDYARLTILPPDAPP